MIPWGACPPLNRALLSGGPAGARPSWCCKRSTALRFACIHSRFQRSWERGRFSSGHLGVKESLHSDGSCASSCTKVCNWVGNRTSPLGNFTFSVSGGSQKGNGVCALWLSQGLYSATADNRLAHFWPSNVCSSFPQTLRRNPSWRVHTEGSSGMGQCPRSRIMVSLLPHGCWPMAA